MPRRVATCRRALGASLVEQVERALASAEAGEESTPSLGADGRTRPLLALSTSRELTRGRLRPLAVMEAVRMGRLSSVLLLGCCLV